MSKIPLVVIVGPTAVGKTDLSIQVAKIIGGEIISADSMQIFKYMDIGTAKPTLAERQGIPHHMMDILDPAEEFSVSLFQQMAKKIIEEIYERKAIPVIVGGTGLYVNSLVYPMNFTEAGVDHEFRKKMMHISRSEGDHSLHNMLRRIDPITAQRLHQNDVRRIIRALEIYHLTGRTMSQYRQDYENEEIPYMPIMIGINMDRKKLYQRINARVDSMIKKGLVDEVSNLKKMNYTRDLVSMQGLGYKEIMDYLDGRVSLKEAIEIIKRDTRRYAKRQLTWFRRDSRIHWMVTDEFPSREHLLDRMVSLIRSEMRRCGISL